jgi:hypothetical protein
MGAGSDQRYPETDEEASLKILEHPSRELWCEVAEACEYATFFQSPLWNELICRAYDQYEDATIGAILDSGTRVILPLLEAPAARGIFRGLESTWNWCPGGVIADGPVPSENIESLYRSLKSWRVGEVVLSSNPDSPLGDPPAAKGWELHPDFSQVLPLDGDLDSMIQGFTRSHRKSLRAALKAGVQVRKAETVEDYREYYRAYESSYDRWATKWASPYPWKLFETGYQMYLEHPQHFALWLAELDGQLASGAWLFYWNRSIQAWHGAAHKEFFSVYPNNALHTEIIRDALERGFTVYDMGASGRQEGVEKFKARFGAEEKPFRHVTFNSRLLSVARGLSRGRI